MGLVRVRSWLARVIVGAHAGLEEIFRVSQESRESFLLVLLSLLRISAEEVFVHRGHFGNWGWFWAYRGSIGRVFSYSSKNSWYVPVVRLEKWRILTQNGRLIQGPWR